MVYFRWFILVFIVFFASNAVAERSCETGWQATGLMVGRTVHRDSDVIFNALELHGYYALPWLWEPVPGLKIAARMSSSVGALWGEQDSGAIISSGPHLRFFNHERGFYVEFGTRATWFTETKIGQKNFGGPLQFGSFLSIGHPIDRDYDLAVRFQHYSNANIYKHNEGIDLGLIELRRRL